jgi:hypothetical protein
MKSILDKARFLLVFGPLFAAQVLTAQFPVAGYFVDEVEIPDSTKTSIEEQLGETGVKCWRVYLCMADPYWELQSIYGGEQFNWTLESESKIFQAKASGGALSSSINPLLFQFVPEAEFDSWFTIGMDDNSSKCNSISGMIDPFHLFEQGGGFVVDDIIGASIFGTWLPPHSQGVADADGRVLIGQFTSAGDIKGTFNFQFRRLEEDLSIERPIESEQVTGFEIEISKSGGLKKCR